LLSRYQGTIHSKWNLTLLFAGAGELLILVTAWTAFQPELKTFSEDLAAGAPVGAAQPSASKADYRGSLSRPM
jgi:hypothetical protein